MRPQSFIMGGSQRPTFKWSYSPGPEKTQSDENFVLGPRGTKMITGWASRRAGREEKLLISATAESFPCLFFLKKKSFKHLFWFKPVPKHSKFTSAIAFWCLNFENNTKYLKIKANITFLGGRRVFLYQFQKKKEKKEKMRSNSKKFTGLFQ